MISFRDLARRWPMVAANEIATIYETLLPLTTKKEQGIFYNPTRLAYSLIGILTYRALIGAQRKFLKPACGAGLLFFRLMNRKLQALSNRKRHKSSSGSPRIVSRSIPTPLRFSCPIAH